MAIQLLIISCMLCNADDIVLLAPLAKGLQILLNVWYNYGCDNGILFTRVNSQIIFFYTRKTGFEVDFKLVMQY